MTSSFGRYRLLERLGTGGMAEVFKAKSYGVEGFEKVVVIKRILPELARSKEFVDMFIHEAKLAVRLSHANIVQVFDLGIAPAGEPGSPSSLSGGAAGNDAGAVETGTPSAPRISDRPEVGSVADKEPEPDAYYMAMEYVHGFDLASLLSRVRRGPRPQVPLPIDMCVYIAAEVVKGLDHAHRRRDEQLRPLNIVHRDVSPQNVLLSLEGEVKVTDFGIAKARGVIENNALTDTKARKIQGKFGYMSPEQARGESVDARSDLFSLGIILYECVAGVNPFSAPTTFETLRRVQACEYPPIELLRPDAPPELVAILNTAMAREPAGRYADAGRMYEAMLAFLYAHGRRYSAHDLAEFLATFRTEADAAAPLTIPELDRDAPPAANERTPVEVPVARFQSSVSRMEAGVRHVALDRAAEMGERREVTALVIEMPVRDAGPQAERAAQIIRRYGGRVVKREPEQIAALFGLGEPDGRDTEVATRCALVALRALDGPRRPSAGIHSARIHVSSDGEPTQDDRLSGLVATARDLARLREGRCAVSVTAMRPLKNFFVFEPLADGENPSPVPVIGSSAALIKEVRGPGETFGRFVGRKDELRRIGEILAAATKRSARVMTVRGDHGIGKTRLFYEVERRLRKGSYNVGWYLCTCPPRGRELPLSGIVCMLQTLCGVADGDSSPRILAVQPRLRALGLHDEEVAAVLGALGASVHSAAATSGNAKSTLRNAFARMVLSLCDDRPHMLAWDAAHAMDTDSFALLESVFQRLQTARVVFAFGARAGFAHPLEKLVAHGGLELGDLDQESVERLVALRLGVDRAPDELMAFVRERAGGHPQFVEEIIKGLVDARAVTVADKKVVLMKLVGQDLALPKTLRGLVASRVARLSANDRATLQAAAVLGDPVDAAVLAQMLGEAMSALEGSLATLKDRDLLMHTGPSELRFTSPIVREVVADALTHEAARAMHAAAGHALESVLGDKAWEQSARIATHLYEAGDREHAATYFAKSAERRLEGGQLEAAARDYARAIDLCDVAERDPAELSKWLDGLAAAVRLVRSSPEAAEMCDRVIARIDAGGDRALRVRARVDAGRILGALHRFDAARAYFDDAETIAEGNESLVKSALVALAEQAGRQGDFKRSLESLERLQRIVTVDGDTYEEHKLFVTLAQGHAALGDRRAALAYLDRAERLLPSDPMATCEREKMRGLVEYFARDFRAAAAACERAVDLHNLGDILIRLTDFPRAYGALQQSLALCDEAGFERLASHDRMYLAFLDGLNGEGDAEKTLHQGIRYAEANDFTWDVIGGRSLLAQLLQRRGDASGARLEFERLRVIAHDAGNTLIEADCDAAIRAIAS
jgi:serine/threonine protein kinase/tetratricopeptide (TPR) repeat protein